MEDMIKRILEADNQAKAFEDENRRETEKEKEKIEDQVKRINDELMEEAKMKIALNEAECEKIYQEKLRQTQENHAAVLDKLRADFEENRDKWIDELVDRVIL